jgi:hypothetical protein
MWRCYSIKKKINLFKKLPEDAWSVILQYISNRNNQIKLLESHERVYLRRMSNVYTDYWRMVRATGGYRGTQVALDNCRANREYFRKLIKTY